MQIIEDFILKTCSKKYIYYPCTILISRKIPNRNSWKQKRANIFTRKLTRKNNDTILLSPKREKKREKGKNPNSNSPFERGETRIAETGPTLFT